MNYAIIAAGTGSRLYNEGVFLQKPLMKIKGTPMIKRLFDVFKNNSAKDVIVVINDLNLRTRDYIKSLNYPFQIKLNVKSTPSSMHSLFGMREFLGDKDFCLTTLDAIFKPKEFSEFIKYPKSQTDKDAIMAITSFIDDEKPLDIKTQNNNITAFLAEKTDCQFVSGGIYYLKNTIWQVLVRSIAFGNFKMRNFQRDLLAAGLNVGYYSFSKIIDVDRSKDMQSRLGRVIDGLAGHLWFISIYFFISLRLINEAYSVTIFILAAITGFFHPFQAAMADYYRNAHLFFIKGKDGSEFNNSQKVRNDYNQYTWTKGFWNKLWLRFYLNFTLQQETFSKNLQRLMKLIHEHYNGIIPEGILTEIRQMNKPLMKYTHMLTFSIRAIALLVALYLNNVILYCLFELIILNIMLIYRVVR